MFHKGVFFLLAAVVAVCSGAAETPPPVTDGEIWNQGVDYYRAGDYTNAVRVLKPLLLTKAFGPRAAEVLAKISYDAAHAPAATDPVKKLEEAATAAQVALKANPKDARVNRNFTRATDGLSALRETEHVNAVLKAAQGKDPSALLQDATKEVRQLLDAAGTYREQPAAEAVAKADQYAAQAEKLSDVWLPVRELVIQAITNQQQAASVVEGTNQARERLRKAARELGDLDEGAYATLAECESESTRFLKMIILPPAAIREDLVAQSNAWQAVAAFNNRAWQPEALDYTRAFRQKFPAWAQAYEQRAQADTNLPPFTAEAQAKVSALSTELEKLQIACTQAADPVRQEKALDLVRQIIGLLPPEKGGGGQQQQNPQQQKSDSQESNGNSGDSNPPQNPDPQQASDPQDPSQDQKEDEQQGAAEAEPPDDKEVDALLKKALERSAEHEEEKKARMYRAPRSENERDW